jgi:membrane-associated phospholipid phosphatase
VFFTSFVIVFLILWCVVYAALPAFWSGVTWLAYHTARTSMRYKRVQGWVQRTSHVRQYAPIVALVLAGAFATVWIGDGFLDLAESVHANNPSVQRIDTQSHRWALEHRQSDATLFFTIVTIVGGPSGLATLLIVIAAILAVKKLWRWLAYLAVTCGGGALMNLELKRYFARARPDVAEMLRRAHGYSFPSGHAMGSTVAFGALSYLAFRAAAQWRWKSAAIALAATLIASVALSRVYLGVHWISDVGAGIFAGLAWVSVCTIGYEALRRIRAVNARGDARPAPPPDRAA